MDLISPTWLRVVAPAAALVGGTLLYGSAWPRAQLFGPVLYRAPDDAAPNRFALLFLGLPEDERMRRIIDALQQRSCHAAFAVDSDEATHNPDALEQLDDDGHLLINHGPRFRLSHLFQGYGFWRHAIDTNDDAVFDAIGSRPRLFCPPFGWKSPVMLREALWGGHAAVVWSRQTHRWWPDPVNRRWTQTLPAGAVLAVDPKHARAVERLPEALDALLTRGLRPQRLDRMLGLPGYRGAP